MTNGNQPIERVVIIAKKGILYQGEARVNGNTVYFYYNHKEDKFQAVAGLNDCRKFNLEGVHNWEYLVCSSIAHSIKNNISVTFNC